MRAVELACRQRSEVSEHRVLDMLPGPRSLSGRKLLSLMWCGETGTPLCNGGLSDPERKRTPGTDDAARSRAKSKGEESPRAERMRSTYVHGV